MTAISARDVVLSWDGKRRVLDGIDVDVQAGEVVGIVGPNGAGKTTLLRVLAGLIEAPSQSVAYSGEKLADMSARQRARARAFVGQSIEQRLPYRIGDVVSMGQAHTDWLFRAPMVPGSIQHALDEVACTLDASRRFDALSGGERQQVVIARALLQGAPRLLFDEPMSALDLRHQTAVAMALRRRVAGGSSVVLTLHDLNLAAMLCDRLYLLHAGKVLACGTPKQVLTQSFLECAYNVALRVGAHPHLPVPTVTLELGDSMALTPH